MQIKLNLNGMRVVDLPIFTTEVVTKMAGNAYFSMPTPTLATVGSQGGAVTSAINNVAAARAALAAVIQQREAQVNSLKVMLTQLADYVQSVSAGDPVKITSAGFTLRSSGTPVGPLPAPEALDVAPGPDAGTLEVRWFRVDGARTYEVQTCPDPVTGVNWVTRAQTTKGLARLDGLPPVSRQCTRVRAVGSSGEGAWTPAIAQTVP